MFSPFFKMDTAVQLGQWNSSQEDTFAILGGKICPCFNLEVSRYVVQNYG